MSIKNLDSSRLQANSLTNDQGWKRTEGVFSTADILTIKSPSLPAQTVYGHLAGWSGELNIAITIQQDGTESPIVIPAGSAIESFKVIALNTLDPTLSLTLGYCDTLWKDTEAKVYSLSRVVSPKAPLTGAILNQHKSITFDDRLYHAQADRLMSYIATDSGKEQPTSSIYTCLGDNDYVGEPHPLMPTVGILAGTLKSQDLAFVITYVPANAA